MTDHVEQAVSRRRCRRTSSWSWKCWTVVVSSPLLAGEEIQEFSKSTR